MKFSAIRRSGRGLLLSLLLWTAVNAQNSFGTVEETYPTLSFDVKLTVNEVNVNMEAFQNRFQGIMALHLSNYFFASLPPAAADVELSNDNFDTVQLRSRMAKTYVGAQGGQSRIQAKITGVAIFAFDTAASIPAINSTLVRQTMTTLTLGAFQGNPYFQLLSLYTKDDILREVVDIEISVENTLISGGGLSDPSGGGSNPAGTYDSPSGLAIAASIVLISMSVFAFALFLHVKQKKRKRRPKNSASGSSAAPSEPAGTDAQAAEKCGSDTDSYLDEWTRSITSIPVRQGEKTAKPKNMPRPATRQSRKVWLFCIAEEDDVIEGESRDQSHSSSAETREDEMEEGGRTAAGCTTAGPVVDSPSGRNELHQFDDVDLSAPADFECRIVNSSMVYL
jgi:hypothetical protein